MQPIKFDAVITMTEEQMRNTRLKYTERMLNELTKQEGFQTQKDGNARAIDLFRGPSANRKPKWRLVSRARRQLTDSSVG